MSLFFLIFHSLVPKNEICLKYILDKNSIKQPQCVVGYSHRQSKSESKGEQHVRSILWPLSAEKALQKNDLAAKSTAWEPHTAPWATPTKNVKKPLDEKGQTFRKSKCSMDPK